MRETKLESWLASNQGDWDEKEYNKIDTKKGMTGKLRY